MTAPLLFADPGTPPRLDWVPISLIDVDSSYQREISGRRAHDIAMRFCWRDFGAVILAPRTDANGKGRYFVTDGQHRVAAARLHPQVTEVPALIVDAGETDAQAANFLAVNRDRRAVTTIERHWAGITARDPDALRVQAVVEAAGCEIAPAMGIARPHMTNAVTALHRACSRYGDNATRLALQTLRRAWPDNDRALKGTLITALARVIEVNPGIDLARLAAKLSDMGQGEISANAEALRKISGGTAETVLARAITEAYNRGLSARQIFFGAEERKNQ